MRKPILVDETLIKSDISIRSLLSTKTERVALDGNLISFDLPVKKNGETTKYRFSIPLIEGQEMSAQFSSITLKLVYPDSSMIYDPIKTLNELSLIKVNSADYRYEKLKTDFAEGREDPIFLGIFEWFLKKQGFYQILDEAKECLFKGEIDHASIIQLYNAFFLVDSLFPPSMTPNLDPFQDRTVELVKSFFDFDFELTTNEDIGFGGYTDRSIQSQVFFVSDYFIDLLSFLVTHGYLESTKSKLDYNQISDFFDGISKLTIEENEMVGIDRYDNTVKTIKFQNGRHFPEFFYVYRSVKKWKDNQCGGIIPHCIIKYPSGYHGMIPQPISTFSEDMYNYNDGGKSKMYSYIGFYLDEYFVSQRGIQIPRGIKGKMEYNFIKSFLEKYDFDDILENLGEGRLRQIIANNQEELTEGFFEVMLQENGL